LVWFSLKKSGCGRKAFLLHDPSCYVFGQREKWPRHTSEELPLPIQRVQTDRGMEFFAYEFQQRSMEYAIKFRPITPRSPHLNGKVERNQKTDREEFYSTIDLAAPGLNEKLRLWQDYNNHERPHGSLGNQTPWEKWWDLTDKTPLHEEADVMYDSTVRILLLSLFV